MKKVKLVIYLVYCLEAGVFLLVAPWSARWEQNFFFSVAPSLRTFFLNPFVRGAISGLGILHLILGLVDLLNYRLTLEEI
ncbi:MAG: hypothetical protein U0166_15915 [Acidobacteriota bacterium]